MPPVHSGSYDPSPAASLASTWLACAVNIAGAAIAGVDLVADVDPQLEGEARGERRRRG